MLFNNRAPRDEATSIQEKRSVKSKEQAMIMIRGRRLFIHSSSSPSGNGVVLQLETVPSETSQSGGVVG